MSKRQKEKKEHIIQVPLYTIPIKKEDIQTTIFPTTYEDIINFLKERLESFSPYELRNNKKEKLTTIESLNYKEKNIGDIPCLLVQCEISDSNLGDTTIEDGQIIPLSATAKVKGAHYYFILYPKIDGLQKNRVYSVLLLVYDDPYHDSNNVCRFATTITKRILNLKPINQKIDSVIHEIEKIGFIPKLQIALSSNDTSDSDYLPRLKVYQVKSSDFRKKVVDYESVPKEEVLAALEDEELGDFSTKEVSLSVGKKQIKVKREIIEGINEIKLSIESVFNSSISITDEEMDKLYNEDFIIEKIQPIIANYLSNGAISSI